MTKPKRYVFQWKEGRLEVPGTWDYTEAATWDAAQNLLCPASMKDSSSAEIMAYLKEHGEVVEYET